MGTHVPLLALAAHERPRERLIALGPAALTDAELVAIQLGSGNRGPAGSQPLAAELRSETRELDRTLPNWPL
jgi:DNA repair protein RadC